MNGTRLKELRKQKSLGQADFASLVGVSQGMISQIENGTRSVLPETLTAIARELNCSVDDLVGEPNSFVRLMRNCKKLTTKQLDLLTDVVLLIIKGNANGRKNSRS